MCRIRQPGPLLGKKGRRRPAPQPGPSPPADVNSAVQCRLLDIPKDFSRLDRRRHADLTNPWLAQARRAARSIGDPLAHFRYRTPNGRTTRRLVEPHGLLVRPPVWYVIAWDNDRHAPRLFRADRISHPKVTDRTFVARPDDLVTGVCPDARVAAGP